MVDDDLQETTDIIICGCGPTGAMLSVLLSQYSIPHVILEKDMEVNADPRGIALDEDGIRYLQACGIYDKIFTEIGQCMENFRFIGKNYTELNREPFLIMNYGTTEGGTGHPGFMCHKQPCIEQNLRTQITALGTAKLRLGSTVNPITEDKDWVYARYTNKSNQTGIVRARFLVGADGKTGFTRKQYLQPKGVTMDQALDVPYEQDWVALNWEISLPTPSSHPDFPLWEKGYTPQQVYDEFFPLDFRFLCNPVRAAVCGRFGLNSDRLWRFEFVVLVGENPIEMAKEDQVAAIVHPYITHLGSRYAQLVPSWKHWLQLGNRRDGMTKYQWKPGTGMAFLPSLGGGVMFPQVYAASTTHSLTRQPVFFTDDIIFDRQKKGIFQVVVIMQLGGSIDDIEAALDGLQELSAGALQDREATWFLDSTDSPRSHLKGPSIYRLASAEEFAREPRLCAGRPEPVGYDALRMSKEVGEKTFVILRPDRFVFAACDTRSELLYAAEMLRDLVTTGWVAI
ncbi:uncharacterized protein FFB14_10439 [Fusarium fujikuroi]|nr:uncharacterized protein FFB14_10439 [Fusarium fujikuroi]